MDVYYWI